MDLDTLRKTMDKSQIRKIYQRNIFSFYKSYFLQRRKYFGHHVGKDISSNFLKISLESYYVTQNNLRT